MSLPPGPMKDLILAATYMVVLFSVLAQGATISDLVRRSAARAGIDAAND